MRWGHSKAILLKSIDYYSEIAPENLQFTLQGKGFL